jgi:hypothetical protein
MGFARLKRFTCRLNRIFDRLVTTKRVDVLVSVRVPNLLAFSRTDKFTSQRIAPSFILHSDTTV